MPEVLPTNFDVAIVGSGILGLAHAYIAARSGKKVVLVEREARANGASIRNFGFITVTGQARGDGWALARRTCHIWHDIAPKAGIAVEQRGLMVTTRFPESIRVVEAFLKTEMGEGCEFLQASEFRQRQPGLAAADCLGALVSPHEIRVESRLAVPQLTAYLRDVMGVKVITHTAVNSISGPQLVTSRGNIYADISIVCPGDDFATLFPDRIAAYQVRKCRLSMLRLASPGFRIPASLMSDLSLARYEGYAALPEADALRARLRESHSAHLANGVHLIIAQSADGSLVVGDSHHYDDLPHPFAPAEAEDLILEEFQAGTGLIPPRVIERWVGVYSAASGRTHFIDAPAPNVRIAMVTGGTGASMCFGIAEKTFASF